MKALKQLYIAVLVLAVGLILIPLFKTETTQQELKGFSARDIQFIESIGFVDNLDGSWSISITSLSTTPYFTYFDYKPIDSLAKNTVIAIRISGSTQIQVLYDSGVQFASGTYTLWGGDVS